MTGFLNGPLQTLDQKKLALVLRTLLDRYPVIITGDSGDTLDHIAEGLVNLVPHRREAVFGSDFISSMEHEQIISHEQSDYNGERMIFRAPSSITPDSYEQITNYKGWVISSNEVDYPKIVMGIKKGSPAFIILKLEGENLTVQINDSHNSLSRTAFEQKLLDKVVSETRMKIERISRVLKRTAHGKVSARLEKSLIDLKHEEDRVRLSLFKEQIQAFVQAAWRTLVILQRLRLLDGVGVKSVISEKMLSQAIDYKTASISRLLEFIRAEWGEDFRNIVEGGRKRSFGDRLEGFWAV